MIKKITSICTAAVLLFAACLPSVRAAAASPVQVDAKSVMLMEQETGQILFEQNSEEKLPIASVTKVMTMLLVMEAIDSGKINFGDKVKVSKNASEMGGSQVYLSPGEEITVNELLKSVAVASGNDAAVALAETVSGSEENFVNEMNKRAAELYMANTHFVNCTGLDTADHYSTAHDVAIMSRELLKHPKITEYTTIWMDSLRNGEFGLSNTNRLIHDYPDANGLKTGSTDSALFCVSASAKKGDMQLIAVVLGGPSSDARFDTAARLLDYGFANWNVKKLSPTDPLVPVKVIKGLTKAVPLKYSGDSSVLIPKGKENAVTSKTNLAESLSAPVEAGQKVGEVVYYLDDKEIGKVGIVTSAAVKRLGFKDVFVRMCRLFLVQKI